MTNGHRTNKVKAVNANYIKKQNAYSKLDTFSVDDSLENPPQQNQTTITKPSAPDSRTRQERRTARRRHVKQTLRRLREQEEHFFDTNITIAEDTRTDMAKKDFKNCKRVTIDQAHKPS